MTHSIDFDDHHPDGNDMRFLNGSKHSWQTSCQQVYINLLRFSEMDHILKSCGLKYLSCDKHIKDSGVDHIHSDWGIYDREDLKISGASVILKKQN